MSEEIEISSDISSNLPIIILLSIPWIIGISTILTHPQAHGLFQAVLLNSILLIAVIYWVASFRIIFFDTFLRYKTPFRVAKIISYSDIRHVGFKSVFDRKNMGPVFRIEIIGAKITPAIIINAKPFSKISLSRISSNLIRTCDATAIDQSVRKWAEKDFSNLTLIK